MFLSTHLISTLIAENIKILQFRMYYNLFHSLSTVNVYNNIIIFYIIVFKMFSDYYS